MYYVDDKQNEDRKHKVYYGPFADYNTAAVYSAFHYNVGNFAKAPMVCEWTEDEMKAWCEQGKHKVAAPEKMPLVIPRKNLKVWLAKVAEKGLHV